MDAKRIQKNFTKEFYDMNKPEFELLEKISMDREKLESRAREIADTRKFFRSLRNFQVPELTEKNTSLYNHALNKFDPVYFQCLELHFLTLEFIYLVAILYISKRSAFETQKFLKMLEESITEYDSLESRYTDIWKGIYRVVSKL